MSRSMSRSRTRMRRTSMSRSSAPVDVSGGRARRPRHHPRPHRVAGAGGAREEPARGAAERRAMHSRSQRRAAMQCMRGACKRGATRNAHIWPAPVAPATGGGRSPASTSGDLTVTSCRRCEGSARSSDSRLHGRDGSKMVAQGRYAADLAPLSRFGLSQKKISQNKLQSCSQKNP